jgi:hypothetical protein
MTKLPVIVIYDINDFMNRREFQLLLLCATSQPDAKQVRELIHAGVDWPIVLKLAEHHGVRPILFRSLKSLCWDAVPKDIQLELDRFNKLNLQNNMLFTGALIQLINSFQENAIPVAAFKGPIIAEAVYGDLSFREFYDVDVVIQESDICKAEDILLTALGYQVADFPDKDFRSAFLSYQGQYAYRHCDTGVSIDLHWQLSPKGTVFPLNSAEIWPRLQELAILGHKVPTLACDDLALYLAAHGTKEGWRRLIWVCDFAQLLYKSQNTDWPAVFNRAHRSHSSRPLLLAILLASTLLDAPAPKELVDKAHNNSVVRALAEEARLRMLRTAPQGELGEFLGNLNTQSRLRHRLRPIATLLTTRTVGDHQAMPLPKPLWGIYYITRPFRLAGKAVKMIVGRD